jgi:hypothetical protein
MNLRSFRDFSFRPFRMALALALSFSSLPSCGPSPQAGGGIGGTGSVSNVSSVSLGPVTKLGTLFVSGTEYDNSNSVYCIGGEPCTTENSLKLGMVVLVKGTAQSSHQGAVIRVADTIMFEETVEGVVQSVAQDGSSLVVLGQFIAVNAKTVIDASIPGQAIHNLKSGIDVVEVSGLVAADGHILATLIMMGTETPHYQVQGIIKNHDAGAKRFEIGQLMVEYPSADTIDMVNTGMADWNGRLAHVRGEDWHMRSDVPFGAKLIATRVKPLGLTVEDSADTKMEGLITQLRQGRAFSINNHPIEISADTRFEGGKESQLMFGAHLFIHGTMVQGVVAAKEVVFKENFEVESNVEAIDLLSGTLTLSGLPGLLIRCDAQTMTEDKGSPSRFDDFRMGDHVKVHGKLYEWQGVVLATALERIIPSTSIVLEAPLHLAIDPGILLAGRSIDTSRIPDNAFAGPYGPIGRLAFFQTAVVGGLVRMNGDLAGGIVTWNNAAIRR